MLIQIHILQNYAPANLNRDDTGSPKDAIFGGKRRGRISSQCLKRSIRRSVTFEEAFRAEGLLGMRTKKIPTLIEAELKKLNVKDEIAKAIVSRVPEIGRESTKNSATDEETDDEVIEVEAETETKQLIFIAPNELSLLAGKLLESYNRIGASKWAKAKIQEITKDLGNVLPRSVDIAMFGRMTTSSAFEDVEAAVQVAHAISTNALNQEFDYFTAVDDLSGESGAGMIGDVAFNSSTYYKYINIHWEKLVENLGGDLTMARQAAKALLEAVVTAQPSGKQNTFAAFNLPDFVLVEITSRNLPVSYANAFLKPAYASGDQTLMEASVDQLSSYIGKISQSYNLSPARAYLALDGAKIGGGEQLMSLALLENWLSGQLPVEK
jgi:CRISPR system Cascade subunit CasC